jgi:hypothetical protein
METKQSSHWLRVGHEREEVHVQGRSVRGMLQSELRVIREKLESLEKSLQEEMGDRLDPNELKVA